MNKPDGLPAEAQESQGWKNPVMNEIEQHGQELLEKVEQLAHSPLWSEVARHDMLGGQQTQLRRYLIQLRLIVREKNLSLIGSLQDAINDAYAQSLKIRISFQELDAPSLSDAHEKVLRSVLEVQSLFRTYLHELHPPEPGVPLPVHLRWTIRRDLPSVLDIENSDSLFPLSEHDYVEWSQLQKNNNVGESPDHRTVSTMKFDLGDDRIDLHNLTVHEDFQSRKIGWQNILYLLRKLSSRRNKLHAFVRTCDVEAKSYLASLKSHDVTFTDLGEWPLFYPDGEDALCFEYRLPSGTPGWARAPEIKQTR